MTESNFDPDGAELAEFLRDFGVSLIAIGWGVSEVDQGIRYVRGAHERGERFGDALGALWTMHREGKLLPKEPE